MFYLLPQAVYSSLSVSRFCCSNICTPLPAPSTELFRLRRPWTGYDLSSPVRTIISLSFWLPRSPQDYWLAIPTSIDKSLSPVSSIETQATQQASWWSVPLGQSSVLVTDKTVSTWAVASFQRWICAGLWPWSTFLTHIPGICRSAL